GALGTRPDRPEAAAPRGAYGSAGRRLRRPPPGRRRRSSDQRHRAREDGLAVLDGDEQRVLAAVGEDLERQRVLDVLADHAAQRPDALAGRELVHEELGDLLREGDVDAAAGELAPDVLQRLPGDDDDVV